jgi:hypothetical protein
MVGEAADMDAGAGKACRDGARICILRQPEQAGFTHHTHPRLRQQCIQVAAIGVQPQHCRCEPSHVVQRGDRDRACGAIYQGHVRYHRRLLTAERPRSYPACNGPSSWKVKRERGTGFAPTPRLLPQL